MFSEEMADRPTDNQLASDGLSPVDKYTFVIVSSQMDIKPHLRDWERLCDSDSTDNVFYTPELLIPNLQFVKSGEEFKLIFIYSSNNPEADLVGVAAFLIEPATFKTPFRTITYFTGPYHFTYAPLFHRNHAGALTNALIEFLRLPYHPWRLVVLSAADSENKNTSIIEIPSHVIHTVLQSSNRSILTKGTYESYESSLPRKRVKDYRRRRKQLEAAGKVSSLHYRTHENPEYIADLFMKIESNGWKGAKGTALGCSEEGRFFFSNTVKALSNTHNLFVVELQLDDETIAISINFVQGSSLFAFRIAHKQEFNKYSPGILTMFEVTRCFYAASDLLMADSCSEGDALVNKYWLEKQSISKVGIPTKHMLSRSYFLVFYTLKRVLTVCFGSKRLLLRFHRNSVVKSN